jgi:hypothetical protein
MITDGTISDAKSLAAYAMLVVRLSEDPNQ